MKIWIETNIRFVLTLWIIIAIQCIIIIFAHFMRPDAFFSWWFVIGIINYGIFACMFILFFAEMQEPGFYL